MKGFIIGLISVFVFASLAWGEPPTKKVEVVNDPLSVHVVGSTPLEVEIVQIEPIEIEIADSTGPVSYEYLVIERNAAAAFEDAINTQAALGGELEFFVFRPEGGIYLGIVRRPVQ